MNGPESFIETLKRIGFPDAHKYKPDEFASMFIDDELGPILTSFCDLTEDNVLSSEELAEYASIPPKELAHLENLAQRTEAFIIDASENEKKEVEFLEIHLSHIEEQNKQLERQKEQLKLHLCGIEEEKDKCEKALVNSKKKFEAYSIQKLPQAQAELISVLQTISKLILEIKSLITDSEYDSEMPTPNLKGAESYLNEEEKLLNYIQDLLSKNFEIEDFKKFIPNVSGHQESKLTRELIFLQRVLMNSKVEELKTASEKEKLAKIVDFYKKCEGVLPSNVFEISASELWSKLEKEKECNEKLVAKEKLIHLYLTAAVAERTDAQCQKIGIPHSEEVVQAYLSNFERLQVPLENVLSHRCRLELIVRYLDAYTQKFADIKCLTEQSSNYLDKEKEIIQQRKRNFEKDLEKEIPKKDKYLTEDSVFLSVFKILKNIDDDDDHYNISSVTMDDVLKKVEKEYKKKEYLDNLQNQQLNIINTLEIQRSAIEKLTFKGKEFADLSEMYTDFNTKLNKTGITALAMKKTVQDIQDYMEKKEKLIKTDRKLRLARVIYLHALSNEKKFKFCIENIKTAAKNSVDFSTSKS